MVLYKLLPEAWLEKKAEYAFFLGWSYSIISIIIAALIFPKDPSLVAIAFTSIMLLPDLKHLFELKEESLSEEKKFSFGKLVRQNRDFVKVYLFLSLGIFLVYSTAAIILPSFQVNKLFEVQLGARGIHGEAAAFPSETFMSIIANNWLVLIACFLVSLLTGDGGIFMITWNLSVWGTIFGIIARNAAFASGGIPILLFLVITAIVGPHCFLEILSYICGSISGGMIQKGAAKEGFGSQKFRRLLYYSMILFLISIALMLIGGAVEAFVIGNSGMYREIIALSYS